MKNKREIMGFAALLIVIYHFWIAISKSPVETGLWRATYVGVDLFFLVSGYSLGKKNSISFGSFIANRLTNIYLPFVVMAGICAVYKKWSILRFIKVITGIEFLQKGGGAFLWFAIAIMLVYLLSPLLVMLKAKLGRKALWVLLLIWLVLVAALEYVFGYTTIFILINRLPVFFIGMYYEEIRNYGGRIPKYLLIAIGIIIGGYVLYYFGGRTRLMKPFTDIYYIIAIPFALAVTALFDYLGTNRALKSRALGFIGGITLELYGFQMIFGYDIEAAVLKMLKSQSLPIGLAGFISFLATTLCLIIIAWLFSVIRTRITAAVKSVKK